MAFNGSLSKQEMLEWLVVKIDELLAISMRVAVAMESIAASLAQLKPRNYHEDLAEIDSSIANGYRHWIRHYAPKSTLTGKRENVGLR